MHQRLVPLPIILLIFNHHFIIPGQKFQHAYDTQSEFSYIYDKDILLWVFDEVVDNKKLVDIINDSHENTKYLKGVTLPSNVIGTRDIHRATKDIDVIIIAVPHEFLLQTLAKMKECGCKSSAVAVSLTKGLTITETGPKLLSDLIKEQLKLQSVAVLMGMIVITAIILLLLLLLLLKVLMWQVMYVEAILVNQL